MRRPAKPAFPRAAYRSGAAGQPVPAVCGTGIRVQTVDIAARLWGMAPAQIAAEYGLSEAQVREAPAFCEAHRAEIEAALASEQVL